MTDEEQLNVLGEAVFDAMKDHYQAGSASASYLIGAACAGIALFTHAADVDQSVAEDLLKYAFDRIPEDE